jgi:hypothetical protein
VTFRISPIGDDVLIARFVKLTPAEAINDNGAHNQVILVTFTGNMNAPDVDGVAVDDMPVEQMRVLLMADAADRIVAGLNQAIAFGFDGRDPDMLDGWIDTARLSAADLYGGLDTGRDAAGDPLGDLLDELAASMHVTLDRPTLRTMAFTLAAVQSMHVVSSPAAPDEPGFAASIVSVLGRAIDLVVRRYDAAGETDRPPADEPDDTDRP